MTSTPNSIAGDPRFDAAVGAIDAGDWPAARAAYRKILDESPADSDAAAGLATVDLYERTEGLDRSPRCSQPQAARMSMPNSWPRTSRPCRATGRRASPASSTPFGNRG